MTKYPLTEADRELIRIATDVQTRNFDDFTYRHTVGCALRAKSGKVYSGVNCDGVHGSCAEFIAMGAAISAGEREFDTIVAAKDIAVNGLLPPCGNCRQMLHDYCPDILVILSDEHDEIVKVSIRDLLPYAYAKVFADTENE
jgi:cytidine deaminase